MVLPYTLPDPDRPTARAPFDCDACKANVPERRRLDMHCGYLPRERWSAKMTLPPVAGPPDYSIDECPGSVVRSVGVAEGAEAFAALEAGILDRYDPARLRVVTQAALAGKQAFNHFEAEKLRRKQQTMTPAAPTGRPR